MDYGRIFARAWEIIWEHKFLILLGVLVALGGSSSGGGNQAQYVFDGGEVPWAEMPAIEHGGPWADLDFSFVALGAVLAIAGVFILFGLAFWAAGTIARGGLIAGVDVIDRGGTSNLGEAFQAGWKKGWRLIGIGLVPAIPVLILLIISLGLFVGYGGIAAVVEGSFPEFGWGAFIPVIVLACLFVPTAMILGLLRYFANRACMLEDLGVISSYRRGLEVLGANLGPALLLFLIQIALSVGIWMMMILPGILIALCCLLWPLLILIEGAFAAYYSTLWTLAWNEFTGEKAVLEVSE